jgi:molybdopterin-dependent oxidoreductase alpha subunit
MNLLLLRGNIGRLGAGPSPVRGHSNVQGNRTCGVNHHPTEAWLARMDAATGIVSPRKHGLDTVRTIEGMHRGDVKVFVGMGGNFVRAVPDPVMTAEGLSQCELTVQVSTKLNRSHLTHGKDALILPCLGHSERDLQASGVQSVSNEDAMSSVQLSKGPKRPASPYLLSECDIIARMAMATLPDTQTPWQWYVDDYDNIRDVMSRALEGFENFNELVRQKYGFRIPQHARERVFRTPSGRAEFSHADLPNVVPADSETLVLQTMRSHDQWNTTIYTNNDRYRGITNAREVVLLNAEDMRERGIEHGDPVDIVSTSKDGSQRRVRRYLALEYDTPRGSAAGYMPEMNALIGAADFSPQSDQPLMKSVHIRVMKSV